MASTDLTVIEPGSMLILNHEPEEIAGIIRDTTEGLDLTEASLDQIKVPSGGGTTWEIETLEGDESVKELVGTIVLKKQTRAYWQGKYTGGNDLPQCSSPDGRIGIGNPGGDCASCPLNAFGTAIGDDGQPGPGKACKQVLQLFVLREDDILPVVINVPPGSLGDMSKFFLRLAKLAAKHRTNYAGFQYRIGLEKDQNATGIKYSKVTLKVVGPLEAEEARRAKAYGETLASILPQRRSAEDAAADAARAVQGAGVAG